ncbi:outer membrane receptor protein involved in Fe transport [Novosphingobium sp. SG751A]|uniref:TonB-dependent receptor domain-containing protein n=1 Tax=Novosphingobium sp. SG751A TaxID=2587000 RepID=UPI001557A2DD|nr:TonB-dependent receptor [Novosphingobium sp. SG751A]NOW47775.1 outer membrane receptor protein involved in Fe transport [Novosphingobium sp. SG751A]
MRKEKQSNFANLYWYKNYIKTSVGTILVSSTIFVSNASAQSEGGSNIGIQSREVSQGSDAIVVTGSRISRRDYTATSPIVTVSAEALSKNANAELEASLNKMPQFNAGQTAFSASFNSPGIATLNLRGLGASRNLVLLDGKRLQPATAAVEIDVNTIPSVLIGNIEVITGGASAVYGSDAISGVVNFQLRRDLKGFVGSLRSGVTSRGDGRNTDVSLGGGFNFAEGRGKFIGAVEYYKRDGIYRRDRPFFRSGFNGGGGASSNVTPLGTLITDSSNLPSAAALSGVFARYGYSGSFPGSASYGFNPDGTLFKASGGVVNYRGPGVDSGYSTNAAGSLYYNPDAEQILQSPMERFAAFGRAEFDVGGDITAYAQGQFTYYTTTVNGSGALSISPTNPILPVTNPFIPKDLAAVLASRPRPTADFGITKRFTDILGQRTAKNDTYTYQVIAGLRGKINGGALTWDVYGSHGHTSMTANMYNGAFSLPALEILLRAPDGGASICSGGFNIFGSASVSQSCKDYIRRSLISRTSLTQDVVEGTIQGGLFKLPAGNMRFAAGASYRRNSYAIDPDPALLDNPPLVVASLSMAPTRGSTAVKEIYGELLVPVFADMPGVKSLELDLAGRYSHYDTSGTIWTYKGDVNWAVAGGFALRAGYQRAVRAPNVGELFLGRQAGSVGTNLGSPTSGGGDPCDVRSSYRRGTNASQVRALCLAQGVPASSVDSYILEYNQITAVAQGNKALKPESADTYTAGITWQSPFHSVGLKNLQLSIDYYNIKLKDAIGVIGANTTLYNCFNANNSNPTYSSDNVYCRLVPRYADGSVAEVSQTYLNLGGYQVSGVDGQVNWALNLADAGIASAGKIRIGSVISYLDRFIIRDLPTGPGLNYAGTIRSGIGNLARWRATSTFSYDLEQFGIGARWRYLSGMKDVTAVTTPQNVQPGVSAYSIFDVFGSVTVNKKFKISAGIDNITDRSPEALAGVSGSTDSGTYDPLGRRFYIDLRLNF